MQNKMTKELVMLLPNVVMLLGKLAMDKRIPSESKMAIVAGMAYFVSPIDLVPDFIPVLGQVEDLMVMLLVIDGVLNHLDPMIVREHWNGDPAMLDKISNYAGRATRFIPTFVKEKVFNRSIMGKKVGTKIGSPPRPTSYTGSNI